MYVTDYTIEMPIIIDGLIVAYANDIDCVISVDEDCELVKIGFRPWSRTQRHPVSVWIDRHSKGDKAIIFQEARESIARSKHEIADLCNIPWPGPYEDENEYTDPRFRGCARQRTAL